MVKEGLDTFSLKVGTQVHKFEAAGYKERDAWIVALEKRLEEAKGLKEEITSKDSYKKTLEDFSKFIP